MTSASLPRRVQLPESLKGIVAEQVRIWYSLMLHDIKNRFFGNGIGYAITIAWPLTHIVVILIINAGHLVPHGTSMVLYAATAVVPFVAWNYIGRFIVLGVLQNKSFLQYPIIKPLDLMIARAALEVVGNVVVVVILLIGMALIGIDVMPIDVVGAATAWGLAAMLGVCFGILNGVITMALPIWNFVYVLFVIMVWLSCGIGIDPEALPEPFGYYMSFNPVLHTVEMMRKAYFLDFHARLLDVNYVIAFSLVSLGLGLVVERLNRAFLLQPR